MPRVEYDEFSLFHENIEEWNLDADEPVVMRREFEVAPGRMMSALVWGTESPTLALVHGGAQNAHTWDTVALALGRPLVAFDLPGHGHSDAGPFGSGAPASHAVDLAAAVAQAFDGPVPLVGMSMGGITSIVLARDHVELVSSLLLVDITPGVDATKTQHITAFVNGPTSFDSFDDLLARTVEHNPTRSVSSLRRGILHNAIQREDDTWVWRHQQHPKSDIAPPPTGDLWAALEALDRPLTLVRGMAQGSVVDDADEAELKRRRPDAVIVHVGGAGHSVQGDQPVELARIISERT
jgi:pimeloyl-ACP methyl ester carboxylesterase